jgi:hypothetical protein
MFKTKPEIEIPKKLLNKLPQGSFVHSLIQNIEPLLSSLNYFPEYTLHNTKHISNVLQISSDLITDVTLRKLEYTSIEYLIAAIVIHDLGMFITRDGLNYLLFGERSSYKIPNLDNNSWMKLWEDFYYKAKRYDDKKLLDIFGDNQPVEHNLISIPLENTYKQRLLFGDFLRQQHHRLAFYIAQIGFPSYCIDIDVFNNCAVSNIDKDIIGLLAYSHGVSLRSTDNYIESYTSDIREYCPVYYLMSVLRIADYLDIGYKRAPEVIRKMNNFHSPISHREFNLNQSVTLLKFDKERKYYHIDAEPNCSKMFLYAESTFKKMQTELDLCWAVLAENYKYDYELSIHRIKSNIFDSKRIETFNKEFLTKKAELGANADLLKLLVSPLYGNSPTYGIRELVSNSVDACLEREEYCKKHQITCPTATITVKLNTNNKTFVIEDNGIGMNDEVLLEYYLIAGASYRSSEKWRISFMDDKLNPTIARNGHFGIGVLATFLIGDFATVTTRNIDDDYAYKFEYSLLPEILNIQRINVDETGNEISIGTKIEIKVNDDALEKLKYTYGELDEYNDTSGTWWNWYHLKKPEISYYINDELVKLYRFILPDDGDLDNDWYEVDSEYFGNVKFNPDDKYRFIINGFDFSWKLSTYDYGCDFGNVSVLVEDRNNIIKTDLTRTLIEYFPDDKKVIEEAYKYYLAQLLILPINEQDFSNADNVVVGKYGYTLFADSFLIHCELDSIYILLSKSNFFNNNYFKSEIKLPFLLAKWGFYDGILFGNEIEINRETLIQNSSPQSKVKSLWLSDDLKLEKETVIHPKFLKTIYESNCSAYSRDNTTLDVPFSKEIFNDIPLIIEYSPETNPKTLQNIMIEVLQKYLPFERNMGWIPFSVDKRKQIYPEAFNDLEKYMIKN